MPMTPLEPSIPNDDTNKDDEIIDMTPLQPSNPIITPDDEDKEIPTTPLNPGIIVDKDDNNIKPLVPNKVTTDNNTYNPVGNLNPKTGDVSVLGYGILSITSIAGLIVNNKKNRR